MIVVLDSGIWISAFQFGGTPQAALDSVFTGHTIAICDQIVTEVRATLVRKFSWKDEEVLASLTAYSSEGLSIDVTGSVSGVCRDPKDGMVFDCALKANAELILSGDNDLLSVKTYRGIKGTNGQRVSGSLYWTSGLMHRKHSHEALRHGYRSHHGDGSRS